MRSNLRGDAGHACGRSRVSCIGLVGLVYLLTGCGSDPVAQKVTASNASATEPAPAPTPKVQTFEQPEQLADELAMTSPTALELPDVTLVNQAGESVRLHALLDGKIVVIQTMFTTCGTICPPLGANFARLQSLLVDLPDVVLVSISVDPITDTPERLRAWGDKFGAGPSWTLLTGSSSDIGKTLKALRVFSAEREQHSSMVVLGDLRDQGQKRWTRIDGLSEPSTLLASIQQLRTSGTPSDSPAGDTALAGPVDPVDNEAAHHYFTDIELVDHLGRPQRLYTDLLRGKIVLVNSFFTSCAGVCPPMTQPGQGRAVLVADRRPDHRHDRDPGSVRREVRGQGWLAVSGWQQAQRRHRAAQARVRGRGSRGSLQRAGGRQRAHRAVEESVQHGHARTAARGRAERDR
jgi:protein SCO1/2